MLIRILALALVISTPALARGYDKADLVRGLCRPDGCDEFSVKSARPLASSEDGTLLKTKLKTFHAGPNGRKDLGEEDGYVYCSRTRPAILADREGRTMAFFLAPFATAASREDIRKNSNYHAVYFAACHGIEEGRAAVRDVHGVALTHGYDVPAPQPKYVALKRAEDILTSAGSRPAEARREGERRYSARPAPLEAEQGDEWRYSARPGPVEERRDGEWRYRDEGLLPPRDVPAFETRRDLPLDEGVEIPLGQREPLPLYDYPPEQEMERDLLAAPRRLTNRAFDALGEVGDWVLGRR
jgi:hypothetical protein